MANASVYAAEIGVALAEAGLAEAARAKIADNLATWPDDSWVPVHAGDALVELDDFNAAEAHLAATVEMAADTDFEALSDANDRLTDLRRRRRKAHNTARRCAPTARTCPGGPRPCGSGIGSGSGSKFKHRRSQTRQEAHSGHTPLGYPGGPQVDEGEWRRKGATISDKTACAEFGLTRAEIVAAIDAGKLDNRVNSTHGNPWFRLLRREVEELARASHGDQHVRQARARAELPRVDRELKALPTQVSALEERRAELIAGLGLD